MNAMKFTGSTSREVLYKVKQELGDDAIIIANRAVDDGIEVLALPATALGMGAETAIAASQPKPTRVPGQIALAAKTTREPRGAGVLRNKPMTPAPVRPALSEAVTEAAAGHGILDEIQRMRGLLQSELAALAVNDMQRRNPVATGILGELLCAGFSPAMARALTAKLPGNETPEVARRRITAAIEQRLPIADPDDIIERGGVFALIGSTGVGKTTTIAKLAARSVMRYGASSVALLTTDSYRIAAQDQLRIYGKILGVSVHAVKDATDLAMLLGELRDKRLVLIDTVGMSQRDRMVASQGTLLAGCREIRKILLLNATASAATLEEVVNAYAPGEKLDCIITKVDEAAGLAPAIDACIRHGLLLHYLTNGQRVPEDIHLPNRNYLMHRAMRVGSNAELTPSADELPLLMADHGSAAAERSTHVQ